MGKKIAHASTAMRGTSRIEVQLRCEIGEFFDVVHEANERALILDGYRYNVDILLPNERIAVKYDSSIYHQDAEDRDTRKTIALADAGWTVIRVRQYPLKAIGPEDVLVASHATVHSMAADVLLRIGQIRGCQRTT